MCSINLHFCTQRDSVRKRDRLMLEISSRGRGGETEIISAFIQQHHHCIYALLGKCVYMWWSFSWTHPLQSGCPRCLPAARQTSLNHAAKWKSIYSWTDLSELPKAYKNNGVCNIIPGTPNRNSLKGEIPSITLVYAQQGMLEKQGAIRTLTCAGRPAAKI